MRRPQDPPGNKFVTDRPGLAADKLSRSFSTEPRTKAGEVDLIDDFPVMLRPRSIPNLFLAPC